MPHFSLHASAVLAAPPDLVWSQLIDRESVSGWLDGIERLSGAGERFSTRRAAEPCSQPIEGRVREIERERLLSLVLTAPWHLLRRIELRIALEPDESGTRLELAARYHLRWPGRLLRPLVRLRAEVALHRASRGFRAAIDDELARRRRQRTAQATPGATGAVAHLATAHEALLRTAS